ncbi:MAG: flagellar transcriptional regulator FlhC [Lautropia sp.]
MSVRSLLADNRQIQRAIRLIELGARLQMLQAETELPYERLLRLYKEVAGKSPSKGQLPFSADWFMTWQPNIHSSLFYNIYTYLTKSSALDDADAIIKAYELYASEVEGYGVAPMLSITRAWRLVRFVDSGLVTAVKCSRCGGQFINHPYELEARFVCGLCEPPARAGKARKAGTIH